MIKILIADDEEHVREELSYIVESTPGFEVLSIAKSGTQVLSALNEQRPDLLLLDIEMPGMNGIEIGNILKMMQDPPYIIYVTAYDHYALDAFNVDAIGYILKPISEKNVKSKLDLIKRMIESGSDQKGRLSSKDIVSNKIVYKVDDRYIFLEQSDLLYAYAKDREVYLRMRDKEYHYNQSLSKLESKLNPGKFFRCHRNFIVSIDEITEVTPWFNGAYLLTISDTNITVSRSNVKELRRILNF